MKSSRAHSDRWLHEELDHDRPLHAAVNLSGPYYFSQCEILVFNLASLHCEINHDRRSLPFFIVTVDIHGRDHLFRFEITALLAQVYFVKLTETVDILLISSLPSNVSDL